eukprot:scaffold156191_cov21-Prasinocladus_malaysianus.AAC.1
MGVCLIMTSSSPPRRTAETTCRNLPSSAPPLPSLGRFCYPALSTGRNTGAGHSQTIPACHGSCLTRDITIGAFAAAVSTMYRYVSSHFLPTIESPPATPWLVVAIVLELPVACVKRNPIKKMSMCQDVQRPFTSTPSHATWLR